jgi:site-specific DNA recombinase
VVRSGRNAGGRAYGYRPVPGKPGQLTIDDAEAEIVRRIFREFIEGATPRAIAVGLNADRIAAPRGTRWTATTINGSLARGHGLLMNELYTGDIVWNRVRMVKDPTTGKRISRPNKAGDYRRAQALHLRIIDQETWDAAQTSKRGRSNVGATAARKPFAAAIRALALRILRRRHDRAGRPATRQAASRAVRRLPRKRYLLERPQGFAISHRDAGVRRAAR